MNYAVSYKVLSSLLIGNYDVYTKYEKAFKFANYDAISYKV